MRTSDKLWYATWRRLVWAKIYDARRHLICLQHSAGPLEIVRDLTI